MNKRKYGRRSLLANMNVNEMIQALKIFLKVALQMFYEGNISRKHYAFG